MHITALPGGTWAEYEENSWNEPNSSFWKKAIELGLTLPKENFIWSTQLDGGIWASIRNLIWPRTGKHVTWNSSGMAFNWWAFKYSEGSPINVITHSHGGNMTLYAAKHGLKINTLITVATPVRYDMRNIITDALPNIEKWYHVYSDRDKWQLYGELGDMHIGARRKMPIPPEKGENIFIPGKSHSELTHQDVLFPQLLKSNILMHLIN